MELTEELRQELLGMSIGGTTTSCGGLIKDRRGCANCVFYTKRPSPCAWVRHFDNLHQITEPLPIYQLMNVYSPELLIARAEYSPCRHEECISFNNISDILGE